MARAGQPGVNGFLHHKAGCKCNPCRSRRGESKPKKLLAPGDPNHKQGCRCTLCAARRRQAKALALGDGVSPRSQVDQVVKVVEGVEGVEGVEVIGVDPKEEPLHPDLYSTQSRPTARNRIASWIEMRALDPTLSTAECSRRMGLNPKTLATIISRAVKEGWLKFDDPLERIEHEIIPKTLDNLAEFLREGDKQVTIEVAKGTIFKQFQAAKGISEAPVTVLALKIETLSTGDQPKIVSGNVVGRSREVN